MDEEEASVVIVASVFGEVLVAVGLGARTIDDEARGIAEALGAAIGVAHGERSRASGVFAEARDGCRRGAFGHGVAVGRAQADRGDALGLSGVPLALLVLIAGVDAGVAAEAFDTDTSAVDGRGHVPSADGGSKTRLLSRVDSTASRDTRTGGGGGGGARLRKKLRVPFTARVGVAVTFGLFDGIACCSGSSEADNVLVVPVAAGALLALIDGERNGNIDRAPVVDDTGAATPQTLRIFLALGFEKVHTATREAANGSDTGFGGDNDLERFSSRAELANDTREKVLLTVSD